MLLKTNSNNKDFQALVAKLDADLAVRDGDDHDFYHQFNGIDDLNHVVVYYEANEAVACGAFKKIAVDSVEIKRMFTLPKVRGKGYASQILRDLEQWAQELGFQRCVLETGKAQPEAIALYRKSSYEEIENYGPYKGVENSLCFQKILK